MPESAPHRRRSRIESHLQLQTEPRTRFGTHAFRPAKSSLRLTFRSLRPRVPINDSELSQKRQAATERSKGRVPTYEQYPQVVQIVNMGDCQAPLLQESFEVFLRRLLTMEAEFVRMQSFSRGELACHFEIGFGFSHPLTGLALHTEPFPCQ